MPRLHIPHAASKRAGWQRDRDSGGVSFAAALRKNLRKDSDLLHWQDDSSFPSFAAKKVVVKDKSAKQSRSSKTTAKSTTTKSTSPTEPMPATVDSHRSSPTPAPPAAVTPAPKKKLPPALSNRRALAVDNRVLQTISCDAAGRVFANHVESFLTKLTHRGAAPCIVASLEQNSKKQIEAKAVLAQDEWKVLLQNQVHVQAPSNMSNTTNRDAVHVPNKLLARNSYKFFGNLVEAIVQADVETFDQVRPLDVTILTNDVAFLSDTKEDSHKHGLGGFWNRILKINGSHESAVGSITFVVVETGAGLDVTNEDGWEKNDSFLSQHRLHVRKCIRSVKNEIMLSSADAHNSERQALVDTEITSIENNKVAFQLLMSKWISQLFSSTSARRITFSLPETVDGTQCSVDLDLSYKIMPFRMDSPAAAQLRKDVELLSQSHIQVLQMIPLDQIDASLLFGIPMIARAGMEVDLSRFHEMKLLVQCLWKYLVEQQVALVLRSKIPNEDNSQGGLYLDEAGETFLLMGEELPRRKRQHSFETTCELDSLEIDQEKHVAGGGRGTLFRYACQDHMLDLDDDGGYDPTGAGSESGKQYTEYIENSCEFLSREEYNPFLAGDAMFDAASKGQESSTPASPPKPTTSALGEKGDEVVVEWVDDGGVGARPSQDSVSSSSSSSIEENPGEFEYFYD